MRFLVLLLLFLISYYSTAEDAVSRITAQLEKHDLTLGRFKQEKRIKFLRKPFISEGEFIYRGQHGVLWKTLSPLPSVLLVKENRVLADQEEQQLPPQFSRIFQALIGGELSRLSEDFLIEAEVRKPEGWELRLKPKEEAFGRLVRIMTLTGGTGIRSLAVEETNGNLTLIYFSEISHPRQLNKQQQAEFDRLSP